MNVDKEKKTPHNDLPTTHNIREDLPKVTYIVFVMEHRVLPMFFWVSNMLKRSFLQMVLLNQFNRNQ